MTDYNTPMGSFWTWEEAAAACERADLDPITCIDIVPHQYATHETAYGHTTRLSVPVRVF